MDAMNTALAIALVHACKVRAQESSSWPSLLHMCGNVFSGLQLIWVDKVPDNRGCTVFVQFSYPHICILYTYLALSTSSFLRGERAQFTLTARLSVSRILYTMSGFEKRSKHDFLSLFSLHLEPWLSNLV